MATEDSAPAARADGQKSSDDSVTTASSTQSTPPSSYRGSRQRSANNRTRVKSMSASSTGHGQSTGRGQGTPVRPSRSVNPDNPRGYAYPSMVQQQQQQQQQRQRQPAVHLTAPSANLSTKYKAWREVMIQVNDLPAEYIDTWKLYQYFSEFAQVSKIDFFDKKYRPNSARIVFSTTPSKPFWSRGLMKLKLLDGRHSTILLGLPQVPHLDPVPSPSLPGREFSRIMSIPATYLFAGVMKNDMEMLGMSMIRETPDHPIRFDLDLTDRMQRIDIRFSAVTMDEGKLSRYRLQAGLQQIKSIKQHRSGDRQCLIISLHDPPKYFMQTKNIAKTHVARKSVWKEWPRMWERQTDIGGNQDGAISLVKDDPVIDSGRWLTYRLDFPINEADIKQRLNDICEALSHFGVEVLKVYDVPLLDRDDGEAWKYLNPHPDLHQMQHDLVHLDFDVRYQLEACISRRCLNEFNMKFEFFQRLTSLDPLMAVRLLENVAAAKCTFDDPMEIFTSELRPTYVRPQVLSHNQVRMHSLTLTPTTLHINTPTTEVSNRVIRHYARYADRFLRVKFEDEDNVGRIFPPFYDNQEAIYNRIRRSMKYGIDIAGRHYDHLAYGNAQMREHGCYFFASTSSLTADQICASLGDFSDITNVAKNAARIGQCFSTTRTARQLPRSLKLLEIPDVWSTFNGKRYCFTDGVGKISPFVANMIADGLRINYTPSVYQFRMGGCKGVLAIDPSLKGLTVAWRPSQNKFPSKTEGLEIIRTSSFQTAYLNQQLILVLSSLGVPDSIFVRKMSIELARIDKAMHDIQTALDLLSRNVDYNQVTVTMAEMIMNGFMASEEPFLKSLMELWRTWRIKLLRDKAHISIKKGSFVLGCTDETQTLRMSDEDGFPEIFLQVKEDGNGKYKAHTGLCLLARNPSLHPGDIRMVKAVACPALSHLKDAVVFPQLGEGERDLANMCSGGDLDGDDYMVMWDEDLFPPRSSWTTEPMDFSPPKAKANVGPVTKDQIIENMINFIRYDRLGVIATRHRAWADLNKEGVFSEQCLELAALHSIAVDFPKSGIPAVVPETLMAVHQWPHWMDNHHRDPMKIYHSTKVLGQLFDLVVRHKFQAQYDNSFDERILNACSPDSMLDTARELKAGWDAEMRAIMAQNGIETEFEVWTAFVMAHNREKRDYVFAEEMGRVMSELKIQHRKLVLAKAGIAKQHSLSEEDLGKLTPLLVAMYTVTRDEMEAAKERRCMVAEAKAGADIVGMKPLISFPWIFTAELGRIATGGKGARGSTVNISAVAPKSSKTLVMVEDVGSLEGTGDHVEIPAVVPDFNKSITSDEASEGSTTIMGNVLEPESEATMARSGMEPEAETMIMGDDLELEAGGDQLDLIDFFESDTIMSSTGSSEQAGSEGGLSKDPGAGREEPGAGGEEPGAGGEEPGAGRAEPGAGAEGGLHPFLEGMEFPNEVGAESLPHFQLASQAMDEEDDDFVKRCQYLIGF